MIVWLGLPAAWVEFQERVWEKEAVTEKEQMEILFQMVQEGKLSASGWNGTKEELLGEISKVARLWRISKRPPA